VTRGLAPSAGGGDEPVATPPWESLLAEIEAIERANASPQGAAPRAAEPLAAAAKPLWSEQPIGFGALKVVDLDVTLTAKEIAYGGLDLKNGVIRAALANGMLDAKVEKLDVGTGKATGNVTIDSVASPPQVGLGLTMTDVAAEPIINEIAGKPLISGTSNVEVSAKAVGQNQNQLASTLEGKAKFRMGKGALRGYEIKGFDFWDMLTNWKTILKFDLAKKTQFERLDAQYDIRKGIMSSSPGLDVGGNQVAINSKGDVNVPRKRITQKLRVTVMPPPTTFSLPVLISGEWAQPSIGIDWGTWFSGSDSSGDLKSLSPSAAAPAPPEVQAAVKRLLSSNIDPQLLSPEGKEVLRALLPPESATGAPAGEAAPPPP
jgi:AsmA protein